MPSLHATDTAELHACTDHLISWHALLTLRDVILLYTAAFQAVGLVQQLRHASQCLQVTGPTSFSGLESMLGDSSGRSGSSSATQHESKETSRKPSLLGRLAGSSSKLSPAPGSMSATDLQNALASSFGARAAAKANNAMKRR